MIFKLFSHLNMAIPTGARFSASIFRQGLSFSQRIYRLTGSYKSLTSREWKRLQARILCVSFKNNLRRHICLSHSKYSSLSVLFLLLLRVAATKKKSLSSKNRLWLNPQCLNTNRLPEQGACPALIRLVAQKQLHAAPISQNSRSKNSDFCISPMNLFVGSFKLAPVQANRGIPC